MIAWSAISWAVTFLWLLHSLTCVISTCATTRAHRLSRGPWTQDHGISKQQEVMEVSQSYSTLIDFYNAKRCLGPSAGNVRKPLIEAHLHSDIACERCIERFKCHGSRYCRACKFLLFSFFKADLPVCGYCCGTHISPCISKAYNTETSSYR